MQLTVEHAFHLQDFTFVCPTEIIAFSERAKQFEQLNCQLIAASCDTEETHLAWIKTPRKKGGLGIMQIPILADTTKVPLVYGSPYTNLDMSFLECQFCVDMLLMAKSSITLRRAANTPLAPMRSSCTLTLSC